MTALDTLHTLVEHDLTSSSPDLPRTMVKTFAGTVELAISELCQGSYFHADRCPVVLVRPRGPGIDHRFRASPFRLVREASLNAGSWTGGGFRFLVPSPCRVVRDPSRL